MNEPAAPRPAAPQPGVPAAPRKGSHVQWVDYLSQVELPVLAETLKKITELTGSSNSTVNQLADVILKDADLTSQVLRLSNTVFYNQTRLPVSTVSRAITLVGFESVRTMAISSVVIDALLSKNPRIHLLRCLARALHAAVQARCLLKDASSDKREEVFIGALLSNIGEMAFWACRTPQADQLDDAMEFSSGADIEREILGTTFIALTRSLAEAWSLGPFVRETVAAGNPKSDASALVRQSLVLVEAAEKGWDHADVDKALIALSKQLKRPKEELRVLVRENALEAADVAMTYGMQQIMSLLPDHKGEQALEAVAAPAGDPVLQLRILRELSVMLLEKPDLNLVFQTVVEGIHRAVGLQRTVLLMRSTAGPMLTPRKLLGQGVAHWKDNFVVQLDQENLLSVLARQPQPLRVPSPLPKPLQRLEVPEFDRFIGRRPGLIGPLWVGKRLVGLVYADNGNLTLPIDDEQHQGFNHFVQQAQICLNNLADY
ncbi:MAG: histidine kinase [Alteromonadaceae bacterium]|nr:histidine kinase [Alteromonadaceae bacterium]